MPLCLWFLLKFVAVLRHKGDDGFAKEVAMDSTQRPQWICNSSEDGFKTEAAMEESSSSSSTTMLKLTASNYFIWKPRMEDILYCKDLYEPLQLLGQNPKGKSYDAWSILTRKAVGQIQQSVDQSAFNQVEQDTDAYILWTKLSFMYEGKIAQNKALMICKPQAQRWSKCD